MTSPTRDPPWSRADAVKALAVLDAEHTRFEEALETLRGLVTHLRSEGPGPRARAAAARVMAALDDDAPPHRAAEERLVLPVLRRSGGPAGQALAARLEAEHDRIARAWSQCRPAVADLATHGRWTAESAVFEFERWRDLADLAIAHMLAEQGAAFPIVQALLEGPDTSA